MKPSLMCLGLLLCAACAIAEVPQGELVVQSGKSRWVMTAKAGWTITTAEYDGTRLVNPQGGQGAVLLRGGKWYGSAMEGGETVQDLQVTQGDTPVPPPFTQALTGTAATVTKQSVIDKLSHKAETVFEPDQIVQTHSFTALEDVDLTSFYAFIYSVTPKTTQWLAQSQQNTELSGEFTTSKGQLVNRDVNWVAQYDPTAQKGVLCYYATPFRGPNSGTRLWDAVDYHKFFAEPQRGKISAGTKLRFQMVMCLFGAEPESWKDAVRARVAELQKRFPPQPTIAAGPRLYDEGVPEMSTLTVETKQYKVVFGAAQAWTINTLDFAGKPIGQQTGYYGTVLIPQIPGGNFIGTGHTDGGREIVHKVSLTVDGQPQPIETEKTVKGSRVELVKDSTIYKFRARTTITVTDDEILERQELVATEDFTLKLMYLFMHCWSKDTSKWLAELPNGKQIEGTFDGQGFEVNTDTRWCAQYEPKMGIGIVGYTPRVASGPGSRTMLWDIDRYHKFYTRRVGADETFKTGDKLDYTMIVRGVKGETGDWTATKATVEQLKAKYPPQ